MREPSGEGQAMGDDAGDDAEGQTGDDSLGGTFQRTVAEGEFRTGRSWPALLATGAVGGLDVGVGVLAALVVLDGTGSELLAALAFTTGFVALVLGRSELFTENFLVPFAAAVAGKATARGIVRLWIGTLVTNLLAGWLVMLLVVSALPHLENEAVALAEKYIQWGITWSALAAGILAGMVITLMTWMERSSTGQLVSLAAAVVAGFPLFAGPLIHTVVVAHQLFGALISGAPFGYLDAAGMVGWAILGNILGGIGLVTVLRLVQVGRQAVEEA